MVFSSKGSPSAAVAMPLVEILHADTGVEDDHAIAAAPRPSLGKSEQPRSHAFALPPVGHRHLLELEGVRSSRA